MVGAIGCRRPTDSERLATALHRIRSYENRKSTIGAREFFDVKDQSWRTLPERVRRLCRHLKNDEEDDEDAVAITAAVFVAAPNNFLESFRKLFCAIINGRQRQWVSEQDEDEEYSDEDADRDDSDDNDDDEMFLDLDEDELYESLRRLGWIPNKLNRPLCEALYDTILKEVSKRIRSSFEEPLLDAVMEWKNQVVLPWVMHISGHDKSGGEGDNDDDDDDNDNDNDHGGWDKKLEYTVAECFCEVRISQIFDVVADYPDSMPAIKELAVALHRTALHNVLGKQLQRSLERRLLHPGADTSQIIDMYVHTIRVLRTIDPRSSSGLLEASTGSVRSYLRQRHDTVRCIVSSLTEGDGDLYEELRRRRPVLEDGRQRDDEEDDRPPRKGWTPEPVTTYPMATAAITNVHASSSSRNVSTSSSQSTATADEDDDDDDDDDGDGTDDILSMLVGIYGSKELFVDEYRILLADKLLANLDYTTHRDIRNLELLKLRFGEASMRQCEVMIKDLGDSKRIIRAFPKNDDRVVDAAIVSHIFWPTLQSGSLTIHPRLQSSLDAFADEYAKLKNPRRLQWYPQIGTVQLQLILQANDDDDNDDEDLPARTLDITCSPLQATLVSHFEDSETWTLGDLAAAVSLPRDFVRQKMNFWLHRKIINVNDDVYRLAHETTGSSHGDDRDGEDGDMLDDDDDDHPHDDEEDYDSGGVVSSSMQDEETTQIYESYVVGMLANLGSLPLERIHKMLAMFVASAGSEHRYDKTPHELSLFLQQLCRDEKIECGADGMYRLVRKH